MVAGTFWMPGQSTNRVSLGQRGTKFYSLKAKASQTPWPCQYCTSTYCVHTVNTRTIRSNLNSLNTFTKCDTDSNKVRLPKVGSNALVPVPLGAGPKERRCFTCSGSLRTRDRLRNGFTFTGNFGRKGSFSNPRGKNPHKKSTHTTINNEQDIIIEFSFEIHTYNYTHTHTKESESLLLMIFG